MELYGKIKIVGAIALALPLFGCGGSDGPSGPGPASVVTCDAAGSVVSKASVTVNGVVREYYEYGPTKVAQLREADAKGISIVMSFHDDGENGLISAQKSCWHEVGEATGTVVIFPSAVGGRWNLARESSKADEMAFVKAAWDAVRTKYALSTTNPTYVTGVGSGASLAHQTAMMQPNLSIAAVAGVRGTADVGTYYLPATQLPVSAMSVWMLREQAGSLSSNEILQSAYWSKANAVASAPVSSSDADLETTSYANTANAFQEVRISSFKKTGAGGKALSERIWNDMFGKVVRFADNTRTNGSLHAQQSISDMKMLDSTKEFTAGSSRRWLTYVPSNYAQLTAGGKKVPLLFSFHGRNGSARWQALISEWNKVAEQNGFIVVYPHGIGATWTTNIAADNADVKFFLSLFDEIKSKYAIDTTRVLLNGSSMGTALTNRIAVQYPELFAAIAPCYSGHLSPESYTNAIVKTNVPIPVWQCRGADEVPSDFPGGTVGETAARNFWRETVNKNKGPATIQVDGRRNTEIWNDGLAEYRWQITADMPHFWHPDQAQKMWAEMLSKYRRLPDGSLSKL